MYKNLTATQLIMIAMAALLLLLATFAFYLLQDPSAPLPFVAATSTYTATVVPSATHTEPPPSPTRRTSYTPLAAFQTPLIGTPSPVATGQETAQETASSTASTTTGTPQSFPPPQSTGNPYPIGTATLPVPSPSRTSTAKPSGTATKTPIPSITSTLSPGEVAITGRLVQIGTPVANVLVSFADDTAPRQSLTDSGGHYFFKTLAPGTSFLLTFKQSENPNLTPRTEIASMIKVEGTLPTSVNPIEFPDVEISLNLNGILFQPLTPINSSTFHASVINSSNPIQFAWSAYSLGGSYQVELGPSGSTAPVWTSPLTNITNYMWDGTLTDNTHITQGTYWWRISVTKSLGNYVEVISTQLFAVTFTP